MKSFFILLALAVISTAAVADTPPAVPSQAGHAHEGMMKPLQKASEVKLTQKAKVLSSINAKEYTYLEVTQNKKTLWLAGATVAVKKDEVIRFDDGMIMTNFHSKTLNRTVPSVTFVNRVVVTNEKE